MNIVLFDGVCNLCNSTVEWLVKHDPNNHLNFATQQSNYGKELMQWHDINYNDPSIILIKGNDVFFKSDAIIEIASLMSGWPKLFKYCKVLPKGLLDTIYDIIARNRYRLFGKKSKSGFCVR